MYSMRTKAIKRLIATIQNKKLNDFNFNYSNYCEGSSMDKNDKVNISKQTTGKLLALNEFQFKKKPHIKIEYEKDAFKTQDQEEMKGLWEPQNWKEFLVNLKIMRSNNDAPVDSMGCHKTMDENASPEVMRYQSLIALMLSSQTKDQVTFAAMERLRTKGLTVDNVLAMSDEELGQLIYPVGFWKTKVKYIKKTTQTLKDQYKGDIPDSVDKLCKLTGVGPKMAHICMQVAWNKITGIGVDTHVHRISNRIGWVRKPTTTPEDTRKALQSWLPFELWSEVNHLMVGFGQTICLPINPICNECLNKDICPSSGQGRKTPLKKSPNKSETDFDHVKQELAQSKTEIGIPSFNVSDGKPTNVSPKRSVIKKKILLNNDIGNAVLTKKAKIPKKNLAVTVCEEYTNKIPVKKKSLQNKNKKQNSTTSNNKQAKNQNKTSQSLQRIKEFDVEEPINQKSPRNKDEKQKTTTHAVKPEVKEHNDISKSSRNKLEVGVFKEHSEGPTKRKSKKKDEQQNIELETKKTRSAKLLK